MWNILSRQYDQHCEVFSCIIQTVSWALLYTLKIKKKRAVQKNF